MRTRRSFLVAGAALASSACKRPGREPPPPTEPPREGTWSEVSFEASPDAPEGERAFLLDPWAGSDVTDVKAKPAPIDRPLLLALHGRGETGRGLDIGAGAWPHEYQLDRLHRRLLSPPLTAHDLVDMTNEAELARLNASLAATPYRGIALACPYTPRIVDQSAEGARPFARFLIGSLLPKLRSEVGSAATRAATGIDGVSMGGRHALLIGLSFPEIFGVVGALQPAIGVDEAPMVSALARAAMAKAPVKLRLVTSEEDAYLAAVRAASAKMKEDGVPHELLVLPGTHSYEFNRGPGGAEMLLWHERTQRGLTL